MKIRRKLSLKLSLTIHLPVQSSHQFASKMPNMSLDSELAPELVEFWGRKYQFVKEELEKLKVSSLSLLFHIFTRYSWFFRVILSEMCTTLITSNN